MAPEYCINSGEKIISKRKLLKKMSISGGRRCIKMIVRDDVDTLHVGLAGDETSAALAMSLGDRGTGEKK